MLVLLTALCISKHGSVPWSKLGHQSKGARAVSMAQIVLYFRLWLRR